MAYSRNDLISPMISSRNNLISPCSDISKAMKKLPWPVFFTQCQILFHIIHSSLNTTSFRNLQHHIVGTNLTVSVFLIHWYSSPFHLFIGDLLSLNDAVIKLVKHTKPSHHYIPKPQPLYLQRHSLIQLGTMFSWIFKLTILTN